jgi:diguanylate cyclase (GGDEF)-like protein
MRTGYLTAVRVVNRCAVQHNGTRTARKPMADMAGPTTQTRHRESEIGSDVLARHRQRFLGFGLILLLAITLVDGASGFAIHLAVVYAIPLLMFTWAAGPWWGALLATMACASRFYLQFAVASLHAPPGVMLGEFVATLLALLVLILALSALRRTLANAYGQSRKDALTGLINKAGFYQVVSAEMEVCRRYRRTLSIAYIDCDNFKDVNDRFGHHAGDELLRLIAGTMARKLRASDLPARLGGDEFAIMLPEISPESARKVIEMLQLRLLHAMREHDWPVTFSIGIATFQRMPQSLDDMVSRADQLMYAVKYTGKGAIRQEVYGPQIAAAASGTA